MSLEIMYFIHKRVCSKTQEIFQLLETNSEIEDFRVHFIVRRHVS